MTWRKGAFNDLGREMHFVDPDQHRSCFHSGDAGTGSVPGEAQAPHSLTDVSPHILARAFHVLGFDRLVDCGVLFLVDSAECGGVAAFIGPCDARPDMLGNEIDKDRHIDLVARSRN